MHKSYLFAHFFVLLHAFSLQLKALYGLAYQLIHFD